MTTVAEELVDKCVGGLWTGGQHRTTDGWIATVLNRKNVVRDGPKWRPSWASGVDKFVRVGLGWSS